MASLYDGLGGEELQISGLQVGGVSISPFIVGSLTATSQISGLNVFAAGSLTAGRHTDANGALFSANVGSPPSYGAIVQAGSVETGAGSTATILFGREFAGSIWFISVTPGSNGLGRGAGSVVPHLTTVTRSGANIIGAASVKYDWVAIGL